MAYGKVPNTLLRTMTRSSGMRPAPGWIRHCHGGTMERRPFSGGHHASRCQGMGRAMEMGWDTMGYYCDMWDTMGYYCDILG